ncbi:hypothetical protein N7532_001584 [Penicillium argentinense]|uniref:Uncharacterized protein n=1 Tax=Penicillium argentinense TaxID=1131581 RepID=A0A9W9G2S7_9EURO|nr:uncharacterized protein N7532_001584 [Penicillium argentinense]KAJ5111049.1 hypothetical protein N7532_001584 [Penicillium argentinense]
MATAEPVLDEQRYRTEVLCLDSAEAEQARAQQLSDEARTLGLKVPDIEASAPLAASIASGLVDLSSPVLSSGSSTDQNSLADGSVTPSYEPSSPSPLDQVVSSPSEITIASERAKPGSTRSLASLSTRPTSYCSSESRTLPGAYAHNVDGLSVPSNRMSMLSIASADKKEKRRSSLKNAIGRIHFRKKRPSSAMLPPYSQILVSKGETGVDHVYLERKQEPPISNDVLARPATSESLSKVEIPLFDKESLQRSLDDPELAEMLERHRMEKNRHMAFQDAALSLVRRRHQTAITERQAENQRKEEEKREQNTAAAIRLEERQLAVEVEQQREFERAKLNSRTRIKHMEGYFRNASPPSSPATTAQQSSESFSGSDGTPPTRRFTQQQKEQLEQQYHLHESMDALHEARIKVLRDRQELKLQEAMERMGNELDTLCEQNIKSVKGLQIEHRNEETSVIQALDAKKNELRHRWHLEEAILRCQLEQKNGQLYGPLPPIPFTVAEPETRDSAICVSEGSPVTIGQK